VRILLCRLADLVPPLYDDPGGDATAQGYLIAKEDFLEHSVEVTAQELADWYLGSANLKSPRNWEDCLTDKLEARLQNRQVMRGYITKSVGKE